MNQLKLLRVLQQTKQSMAVDISKYFTQMNDMISQIYPAFNNNQSDTRFFPGYCIPFLFFVYHMPKYLPPPRSQTASSSSASTLNKKSSDVKTAEETLKVNLEQQLKILLAASKLDRGTFTTLFRAREREGFVFFAFF